MRVAYTARATAQLEAIKEWIARDDPERAARVAERIISSITGTLSRFPYAGQHIGGRNTRRWVVPRLPYVVIYRVDKSLGRLVVLGVFHSARHRRRV